jgi:hypothetical protein
MMPLFFWWGARRRLALAEARIADLERRMKAVEQVAYDGPRMSDAWQARLNARRKRLAEDVPSDGARTQTHDDAAPVVMPTMPP